MEPREGDSVLLVRDEEGVETLIEEGFENSSIAVVLELERRSDRSNGLVPPRPLLLDGAHELRHRLTISVQVVALGPVHLSDLILDLLSCVLGAINLLLGILQAMDVLANLVLEVFELVARSNDVRVDLGDFVVEAFDLVENGLLLGLDVAVELLLLGGDLLVELG